MEETLDNMYESMPSVPAMVYFARRLNRTNSLEDNTVNTRQTLNNLIAVLSNLEFETLEKKHLEFMKLLTADKESEYTVSSEDKQPPTFMEQKIKNVSEQLSELNDLDKKLTTAIYSVEEKMKQVKSNLDLGTALIDQFSMEESKNGNSDFSALFEEKTTETQGTFGERLPEPLPLQRSIAVPPPGFQPEPRELNVS